MNGEEHDVLQLEKTTRTQDTPICCNGIFKPLLEPGWEKKDQIKTFLTKRIAGIRKNSLCTEVYSGLAERKANQDVDLKFVLPFR